jgi:hypothetical protein
MVLMLVSRNARSARVARDDANERERISVRAALIEELQVIRAACSLNMKTCEDAHERNVDLGIEGELVYIGKYEEPQIYGGVLDKIGLLPPREVASVVRAYLAARYAWRRAEAINQNDKGTADYMCVLPADLADTGNAFGLALNPLNHAFKTLRVRPENPNIVIWGPPPGLEDKLSDEELYDD